MVDLRTHGDYKLADLWLAGFVLAMRLFAPDYHRKYQRNIHTVSIVTDTIYHPVDHPPSTRVITHEQTHLDQAQRDGHIRFALAYILSRKARLRYEAEAYHADGRDYLTALNALASGVYLFVGWDRDAIAHRLLAHWRELTSEHEGQT